MRLSRRPPAQRTVATGLALLLAFGLASCGVALSLEDLPPLPSDRRVERALGPRMTDSVDEGPQLRVSDEYANVRSGPGTDHERIGRVEHGERLWELGEEGDWYRVTLPTGEEGWIYKPLLEKRARNETVKFLAVDEDGAIVRQGPGTHYQILDRRRLGDLIQILDHDGNWLEIRTPEGVAGWMYDRLFRPPSAAERNRLIRTGEAWEAYLSGRKALDAGNLEEARAAFARTIQLRPEIPWFHLAEAHVLAALGQDAEALSTLELAAATAPQDAGAERILEAVDRAHARLRSRQRLSAIVSVILAAGMLGLIAWHVRNSSRVRPRLQRHRRLDGPNSDGVMPGIAPHYLRTHSAITAEKALSAPVSFESPSDRPDSAPAPLDPRQLEPTTIRQLDGSGELLPGGPPDGGDEIEGRYPATPRVPRNRPKGSTRGRKVFEPRQDELDDSV